MKYVPWVLADAVVLGVNVGAAVGANGFIRSALFGTAAALFLQSLPDAIALGLLLADKARERERRAS